MTAECPLCGTSVALLRRADARGPQAALRERIATLRRRADELASGILTPRKLIDDALWTCTSCQRIIVDSRRLDGEEMRRRIQHEARRLERAS
jgi:hypothetical protein